jgi:hypothetical protein
MGTIRTMVRKFVLSLPENTLRVIFGVIAVTIGFPTITLVANRWTILNADDLIVLLMVTVATIVLTCAMFLIWYRHCCASRVKRAGILGSSLLMFDSILYGAIIDNKEARAVLDELELKPQIDYLLNQCCHMIADNFRYGCKGASFWIRSENPPGTLEVYATAQHDMDKIRHRRLGITSSFAGQVMDSKRCMVIRDSRDPPRNIAWQPFGDNPTRFRGRAAVAVIPITGRATPEVGQAIGVLCVDILDPWEISGVDRAVMTQFAVRIGQLWSLFRSQPTIAASPPPRTSPPPERPSPGSPSPTARRERLSV